MLHIRYLPDGASGSQWAVMNGDDVVVTCGSSSVAATRLKAALSTYEDTQDIGTPADNRVPVSGIAVLEGMWTGDGRQFARGSLTWPDPGVSSVPLQWQKETSHGGDNDNTVNVGWLTDIRRNGDVIEVSGVIDTESPDGVEAARFLNQRGRFGVSIVADDPEGSDVEFVYPEGCDQPSSVGDVENIPLNCLTPNGAVFHSGRIRALTMVDVPAFVDAFIEPVAQDSPVVASGTTTLGAVAPHDTATVDESWDNDSQESRLDSPMSLDTARSMYAWINTDQAEDGEITKSACRFPHHEVNADGTPGAANLTACSAGIGALNGARGGTTIPREDMQGVYDHLAAHLRDADREPPPPAFSTVDALEPLVAASHIIQIPDTPPAEWFDEPADLPEVGAITVTDDGRIFGLLAPAGVAHRSFAERITVPTGVDYSRWMNRQTITADGTRVTTGPLTMECGHASTDNRTHAQAAIDHYDNSCAVVATVRIGESRRGTWVSGALLPGITPYQVARMLACQLSGDWRPHREEPGRREFCGALFVPVPGFPVAASASVRVTSGELVAASAPVSWQTNSFEVMTFSDETEVSPTASEDAPETPEHVEDTDKSEVVDLPDSQNAPEADEGSSDDADDVNKVSEEEDDLPSWDEVQAAEENRRKLDEIAKMLEEV